MTHFFSTLQREPFSTNQVGRDALFNIQTTNGHLANYLIDPQRIFADELSRNIVKLFYNLSNDAELARERFKNDIAVINIFFDTPIITEITQELRTSVFDMISAIGGTLGLFTGISVITLVEVVWWLGYCLMAGMTRASLRVRSEIQNGGLSREGNRRNMR